MTTDTAKQATEILKEIEEIKQIVNGTYRSVNFSVQLCPELGWPTNISLSHELNVAIVAALLDRLRRLEIQLETL